MSKLVLSKRWTLSEHEGILCGKMGRGDLTHWATATTRFHRPDDVPMPDRVSRPVRNLGNVNPVKTESSHQQPQPDAVLIGMTATDNASTVERKKAQAFARSQETVKKLARFYSSRVKPTGNPPVVEEAPLDPIDPNEVRAFVRRQGGGATPWC